MTYASANRRPNPAALLGALGIPGAFGALLVVGLAVTAVTQPANPRIKGVEVNPFVLPPPPPPPTPDTAQPTTNTNPITMPTTPSQPTTLPVDLGIGDPVVALPGTGDLGTATGPIDFGTPGFGPSPSASPFDPVGARPKGNPGKWVTNDDYRPRWIMEELSGTARFTLAINASGKVTGCTVTRSTGHAPLDAATCTLVTKRARFDAARDGNGKAVAGSYSGTITWRIPE